eukprot:scaffold208199_cov26-Tisochrysis_lutea.AAC.4
MSTRRKRAAYRPVGGRRSFGAFRRPAAKHVDSAQPPPSGAARRINAEPKMTTKTPLETSTGGHALGKKKRGLARCGESILAPRRP